jgi:copper chaperone CopZ
MQKNWIFIEVTMIKKIFKVEDMHCANCAMKIESIEDDLPGIREVNASYVKQQMTVEYDENTVSADEIIAAVKKRGYRALPVQ